MTPRPANLLGAARARMGPMAIAALAAAIVVFLATLLRQEGVPKIDTLWAEDGAVFLGCAFGGDAPGCFLQPYQGYLHLVPRAIAALAAIGPASAVSALMTVMAALVAALCAAIATRSIVDATGSALAGFLGGSGLGLVWQAGREVLGNAANIHWVLLAASIVAVACVTMGAPVRRSTIALSVAACLTSAFAPLVAVGAGVALLIRRPHAARLFVPTTAAAMLQVLVVLTSERVVPDKPALRLGELAGFVRTNVIGDGSFGPWPLALGALVPTMVVLLLVALALIAGRGRVTLVTSGAVGALIGTALAVCIASMILNRSPNPRYAYLPATMIVAGLAIAAAVLARELARSPGRAQRLSRFVVPMIVVAMGLGFGASFRLEARASTGPNVPAQLAGAAASCSLGGVASISISPRPASSDWILRLPCARLPSP